MDGLRPLDPVRDLWQVAELIEEAFDGRLSREGRGVIRDLRLLSLLWPLVWVLDRTSPEFHDFLSGFVWVEGGKIVGHVTLSREGVFSPRFWISNLAVARAYQGRGIAKALMKAAIEEAREQGGEEVILRVKAGNEPAISLYRGLGFDEVYAITKMRLNRVEPVALTIAEGFTLRRISRAEWEKEYELAREAIPRKVQLLKPVREADFRVHKPFGWLVSLILGRREHRFAIDEDGKFIATLTVYASRWWGEHRIEMTVHPEYRGHLEDMLITKALIILARHPKREVIVEHPSYHREAMEALKRYGFVEEETLIRMKLDLISTHHRAG